MRAAILHFHLRPGGVTRVIELTCEALRRHGVEPLVIVGEPAPGGCRVPAENIRVVPDLAYGVGPERADPLLEGVESAMRQRWRTPADVVHVHNHALGKNFALPAAVTQWAREGRSLLLQPHDFAESGRPANYRNLLAHLGGPEGLSRTLYPTSPHVGYALLNSADRRRLAASGLVQNCDLLPNPVSLPPGGEAIPRRLLRADRAIVYPTRAIRRKNIGEAILWAALAAPGERVILTAAPPDRERHDAWRDFAAALGLPVTFEAQTQLSRPAVDFLVSADLCLTTSVEEGFGMAFLEPWLAGRPLAGRDLPGLTRDFRREDVTLDHLYQRLDVPAPWIEAGRVEALVTSTLRRTCEAYGVAFEDTFAHRSLQSVRRGDHLDFGRLDEGLQQEIIHGLASGKLDREAIVPLAIAGSDVAGNQEAVRKNYSLASHGERLLALYQRLAAADRAAVSHLDATRVLRAILRFDDFFALRG